MVVFWFQKIFLIKLRSQLVYLLLGVFFILIQLMSKLYKTKKAALARRRREREKKHLEVLRQLASAPTATSSVQREYHAASERRSKLLKCSRETAAS